MRAEYVEEVLLDGLFIIEGPGTQVFPLEVRLHLVIRVFYAILLALQPVSYFLFGSTDYLLQLNRRSS